MRFAPTIFSKFIAPIDRRHFTTIVARHGGDARFETLLSWDHLLVLVFAQMARITGLRGLEGTWNANRQHHYHLGSTTIARSTVSDAGKIRPVQVFTDTFAWLAGFLDRTVRRDGKDMLCVIDSTPIPLGKLCDWAKSNGRFRGLKAHVAFDPHSDCPRLIDITAANVNDAEIGRTVSIQALTTYVFDKGYCHYGWWRAIDAANAFFVTRPKDTMGLSVVAQRPLLDAQADGCTILEDAEVRLSSKGDSKLPMRLRRVTLRRDNGQVIKLITNDMSRSALAIAALYRARWQIELLFRWIKQHLCLDKFMANNVNAIKLQIVAAMIAYALLRIAANDHRVELQILRFGELVAQCLFERRDMAAIDKPPPVNPSKKRDKTSPDQWVFSYVEPRDAWACGYPDARTFAHA